MVLAPILSCIDHEEDKMIHAMPQTYLCLALESQHSTFFSFEIQHALNKTPIYIPTLNFLSWSCLSVPGSNQSSHHHPPWVISRQGHKSYIMLQITHNTQHKDAHSSTTIYNPILSIFTSQNNNHANNIKTPFIACPCSTFPRGKTWLCSS